jgi:hypothetical protein
VSRSSSTGPSADNWTIRTNLTLGDTRGNNFGDGEVSVFKDTLFDALGGVDIVTGRTDATVVNREGVGNTGRSQILNIVGLKQFLIGKQTIGLGGYFGFRSGERWGLRGPSRCAAGLGSDHQLHDLSPASRRRAARGHHDAQPLRSLVVPDRGAVQGQARRRAVNVTNEQELIGIEISNGQPDRGQAGLPGAARVSVPDRS